MTGKKILEHAEEAFRPDVRAHADGNFRIALEMARAIRAELAALFRAAGIINREQEISDDTAHELAAGLRERAEAYARLGKDDRRFQIKSGLASLAELLSRTH